MPGEIQENKKIKSVRQQNKFYIISFYDIVSCETAAKLRGATLKIKRSGMPELEDGVFFHEQIIGLRVITTGGDIVGTVEEIFETRANDVYIVKKGDREYLIPAVKEVIKKIDIPNNRIIIEIIDGLLDVNSG